MMRNIIMLALANLRKNKGQAISILAVILLATTLLSIGLIVLMDIGRFFDERVEYLNAPHFAAIEDRNASNNDRLEFIEQFSGVVNTETQDIIGGLGGYYVDGALNAGAIIITDGSVDGEMNPLSLIGDYLPLEGDAIYIPHFMLLTGYSLGDSFQLDFLGEKLDFTVAGSTEDIPFGDQGPGNWRVYVPHKRFLELEEEFPNNQIRMLFAQLEEIEDAAFLMAEYNASFFGMEYAAGSLEAVPFPWTLEIARLSRLSMPSLVATFLTTFSLMILAVGIIVTRFRITSSIEEGMINLGALKAIGYRNRQIISSIVLQFGFLALVGSMLGMLLSYLLLPLFSVILEPLLGLAWIPTTSVFVSLIAMITLILLVVLFSFASAKRIRKFHPLVALRGGLNTHSFKKNHVSLDEARGPLVYLLAIKQLLQSKKQAFAISLILAVLMVASVVGIANHYNVNVNTEGFLQLFGADFPDVVMIVDNEKGGEEAVTRISERPEVDKVQGSEFVMLFIDEVMITTTVVEDFSSLTGDSIIEGRFPQHDNEMALGIPALRVMDKAIGDWVTVVIGEEEREFLITGSLQTMNQGGLQAMINVEGMIDMQPDFAFSQFDVHLIEGINEDDFIEYILEAEGDALANVFSVQDQMDTLMVAMGGVFALITVIILVVAVAVIILVLYMVIKTTIRRRSRELGIQKALGFTTLQLMNQISLNLMPAVLLGTVIGAAIGYFGFNPMFIALMQGVGIARADMIVPLGWIAGASVVIVMLAYAVSMLIAWRIRKISAYALVTE